MLRSPWRCTSCSLIHFSGSLQWPLHVIALEGHARIHISGIDLVWKGKEETMMKPRGEGKKKKKKGLAFSVVWLTYHITTPPLDTFLFNIWHSVFPMQLLLAAGQGLSDLAELDVPCLITAPRSAQEALLCPVAVTAYSGGFCVFWEA